MSYYAEPYSSRKRRSKKTIFLVLLGLTLGLGIPGYLYGPRLYYLYSGDPILRLEKRSNQFEADLRAGNRGVEELYDYLEDSRRVLSYLEKDNPARAEFHYYRGLFRFYELLIRLPFNGDSALRLIGRLYLPEENPDSPLATRADLTPIPELGKATSQAMRTALALDPDLPEARAARLVIAMGDLIFTARTDPILLEYLNGTGEMPPFFEPYHAWLSLVLLGLRGEVEELEALLAADQDGANNAILKMTPAHLDLARSFGSFYARQYIRALQKARGVKFETEADPYLKSEAVRMEGEIFLVQRGPGAARSYFQEALKISEDGDEYLKNRLAQLEQ